MQDREDNEDWGRLYVTRKCCGAATCRNIAPELLGAVALANERPDGPTVLPGSYEEGAFTGVLRQPRGRPAGAPAPVSANGVVWVAGRRAGMELRVHKVQQMASGGSHVTIYEAEVELVSGGVQIEMSGVYPQEADPADVKAALEGIRRGAEQVLSPRGQGAIIRVGRIVIHPVDFKPRMFEQQTAVELARLLSGTPTR